MGRGIAILDGGQHRAREEEVFLGGGLFSIFTIGNAIASSTVKCFRFVCENFTTFPFGKRIVESSIRGRLGDIFTFKIKLWVYEKLAKT